VSLNLTKGQGLSLTKNVLPANKALVGLGWNDCGMDLDVIAFILDNSSGKPVCKSEENFIFFNNKNPAHGAISHNGDNRTGAGEGDDESLNIDFTKLSALSGNDEVAIFVIVYSPDNGTFDKLSEAFVRIVDTNGKEICRYDMNTSFPGMCALQVGSFSKEPSGDWKFSAIGAAFNKRIGDIAGAYGF
jgi:tellurium resistance protein TerD